MKICPRGKGGHGVSVGLHMKLTIEIENPDKWGHNPFILPKDLTLPQCIDPRRPDTKAST